MTVDNFFSLLLSFVFIFKVHSDVISLQNSTYVYCVAERNESSIFISPPLQEFSTPLVTFPSNSKWFGDDWIVTNASSLMTPPVTDERWEGFQLKKGTSLYFGQTQSVSFSVYAPFNIIIFLMNNQLMTNYIEQSGKDNDWYHFGVTTENQTLRISKNNKPIYALHVLMPVEIYVVSKNETFWKIHDYQVRWANFTSDLQPTSFTIPQENKYLILYTLLCKECFLEVYINNNSKIISGSNETIVPINLWQADVIELHNVNLIKLFRRTRNGNKFGYWGIDLRLSTTDFNKVIYKISSDKQFHENNYTCHALNSRDQEESTHKENQGKKMCDVGYFGKNCNLSCENILGKTFPYCEGFKICDNSNCSCSWGYGGPSCQNASGFDRPQNLRIQLTSNPNEILLLWEHILYKQTKTFCVEIDDGRQIKKHHFTSARKNSSLDYTHLVNIKKLKVFKITLWESGFKETINVTVISPIPDFSSIPFIQWCSCTCVLSIPKPNNPLENVEILVAKRSEKSAEDQLLETYKLFRKGDIWIANASLNRENLEVEIGSDVGKAVFIQNKTYMMHLIWINDQKTNVYPIRYASAITILAPKQNVHIIVTVSVLIVLILLSLGIIYYVCVYKKRFKPVIGIMGLCNFRCALKEETQCSNNTSSEMTLLLSTKKYKNLTDFENYVNNELISQNQLRKQFNNIAPETDGTFKIGSSPKNQNKNRDNKNNRIPYDHNRVILQDLKGVGKDDYINASYINGYHREKYYIACQGPKFNTVSDFWRMIWQENVKVIVMTSDFIEDKRMCAEYWPQWLNSTFECGKLSVVLFKEEFYEYYSRRFFKVEYDFCQREILHLHLKWNATSHEYFYSNNIVPVIKHIRDVSRNNSDNPIVIHSGYGTNRTGTLILSDLAIEMTKTNGLTDFTSLLYQLRAQRFTMISSIELYLLAHLIVLDYLLEKKNPFQTDREENEQLFQQQLLYLNRVSRIDKTLKSWKQQNNSTSDNWRPSYVDGYGAPARFLVTSQPSPKSVAHFWKTIAQEKINSIVSLQTIGFELWPYKHKNRNTVTEVIKLSEIKVYLFGTISQIKLLTYESSTKEMINEKEISFVQLSDWTADETTPKSPENILSLAAFIYKNESNFKPLLIMCHDGVKACGLFVALLYITEKYKKELAIDVCTAVRTVRRSGIQFISTLEELTYVHLCVSEYKEKFDYYSHVKYEDTGYEIPTDAYNHVYENTTN